MELSTVNIIQAMLAPGIMISACGLLLLGVNSKYSLVISRIRLLDEEKRKLTALSKKQAITPDEEARLKSITHQIPKLVHRFDLIRNIVISYAVAVSFFIVASFAIGIHLICDARFSTYIAIALFLAGMVSVLVGIFHAAMEAIRGHEILIIEIEES
ncbi:MAG: DUF2721 domain-containing protein [Bacteroidia bacterium]|nr:DUF2721 domain-containing protein [Bacteroidia bacterium]